MNEKSTDKSTTEKDGASLVFAIPLLALAFVVIVTGALLYIGERQQGSLKTVPDFAVEGLSAGDLRGSGHDLQIVNFFASWCLPCEAEHPFIAQLAESLPVYGIAFMDAPEKTESFLDRLGRIYNKVGYDLNGTAGISWGVTGVPATFLIDSKGYILLREDGPLTPKIIDEKFMPLIESAT